MNQFEAREVTHEILSSLVESIEERAYPMQDAEKKPLVIVCECGARILLVPDLNEMGRTIEAHAAEHGRLETFQEKAEAECCRIELMLIQKTLSSIAGF